jgi:hypothetical protein
MTGGVATVDDYESVRTVLNGVYSATATGGLTEDVKAVVGKVRELRGKGELPATYEMVAKALSWTTPKTYRKVAVALRHGWLINKQDRPRQPADLDIGSDMPDGRALPTADHIRDTYSQNACKRANARNSTGSSCKRSFAHEETYANDVANAQASKNAAFARFHASRGDQDTYIEDGDA